VEHLKLSAIVLRVVDYGESDRVVTLLSRERGKVSAFARGARASRRRFGGALEPFTLLVAEVRARSGSDLLGLESVAVERGFGGIRADLARIACAGYAAELTRELVRDHEPHEALFELLATYLGLLEAAPARPSALRAFELGALRAAGFMPRLDGCARCGGALVPGPRGFRFDPSQGGLVCGGCTLAASPGCPVVAPETAAALVRLQDGGLAAAEEGPLTPVAGREARDALAGFIVHLVGHGLAARRFLDEVGPVL
jgi:DNA repair protein RecO (recombination protein O)